MNIKRFFGKNSKLALAQVREALGENAVILSNRSINGGNEIMAFSEADIPAVPAYDEADFSASQPMIEDAQSASLEALFRKRMQSDQQRYQHNLRALADTQIDEIDTDVTAMMAPAPAMVNPKLLTKANAKKVPAASDAAEISRQQGLMQPTQAQEVNAQIAHMMHEIRNMRSVIESQLAEISWGAIQHREPVRATVLGQLLSAGFSAALSKQLAEKMPAMTQASEAKKWAQTVLLNNLSTLSKEDEILDQGGIFALVGPTGVGKTTTTAKLAARYVMKHGTEKIGLITTDAYRIGGHEQLRIYGKILGVMVHSVKDEADLKIALNELKNKHTILIDTVGVSQRDQMVSQQIALLSNSHKQIKKLLCLNATNTGDTLLDVVNAYKGKGLDGCIMTKMDEAITLGNVLDVIIREKLKLFYVANGQRVPEDLHVAHKQQLLHLAFKLGAAKSSPFQHAREDLPFVMGNTVQAPRADFALELDHA